MPIQIMMKIDGVVGESKSFKHQGWADVLSWNWGMTSNRKLSQTIDGDKTSLNEISIVKAIGSDSSDVRRLYAEGALIPSVNLSMFPAVAKREVPMDYVDIKLEGVLIKSIVTGGGVDDLFFKEHITLLFDKVRFEYKTIDSKSKVSAEDAADDFVWNVSDNRKWNQATPEVVQELVQAG